MNWTKNKVAQKSQQIATVLAQVGQKETQRAPLIIGLAEIENKTVLRRITQHKKLAPFAYGMIHFESPDYRGIDVALLYQKNHFIPESKKAVRLDLIDPKTGRKRTTRDILIVSGYLNQYRLSILINHWPSRRGGKIKSAPHRFKAAQLHLKLTDSLLRKYPKGKIISMGDYNDNPTDKSVQWIKGKKDQYLLFNPMEAMAKKGIGSLAHNDRWFLFDQLLFSENWKDEENLLLLKTAVFNPKFLQTKRSNYQGYPYRTQHSANGVDGYSDHFPVYTVLDYHR